MSMIFAISGTQTTINSAARVATPTPSGLITTIVPQETDTYFAVENNQISYGYSKNLGMPCYYKMAGRVLDLNGEPFTDFVVNIQMITIDEVPPPERPGYAFPGEGYETDGAAGWGSLLPSWSADYEIWLTTEIDGEELSPHIYVDMRECDQNEARINFVQVKLLPANMP
jgi:hypothetical protein